MYLCNASCIGHGHGKECAVLQVGTNGLLVQSPVYINADMMGSFESVDSASKACLQALGSCALRQKLVFIVQHMPGTEGRCLGQAEG